MKYKLLCLLWVLEVTSVTYGQRPPQAPPLEKPLQAPPVVEVVQEVSKPTVTYTPTVTRQVTIPGVVVHSPFTIPGTTAHNAATYSYGSSATVRYGVITTTVAPVTGQSGIINCGPLG